MAFSEGQFKTLEEFEAALIGEREGILSSKPANSPVTQTSETSEVTQPQSS